MGDAVSVLLAGMRAGSVSQFFRGIHLLVDMNLLSAFVLGCWVHLEGAENCLEPLPTARVG